MSTGMATVSEIADAVETATSAGAGGVALLHCNSAYPSPPTDMDLRTIPHLRDGWNLPVGLSDHTLGMAAAIAAVALGASIIEKHFTLSRQEPGPDTAFSLEPAEFAQLSACVRQAEDALGSVRYGPSGAEKSSLAFRRSLFVVEDVRQGEAFSEANVRSIRPADGLPPRFLPVVTGRRAARDLRRGTPLSWDVIA